MYACKYLQSFIGWLCGCTYACENYGLFACVKCVSSLRADCFPKPVLSLFSVKIKLNQFSYQFTEKVVVFVNTE